MGLKELLGQELYDQVATKLGGECRLAVVSDGSWIPKDKFNEANTARKIAENALKERDEQIDELKRCAGEQAALREQLGKLRAESEAAMERYEAELKGLRLETAVKLALSGKIHEGAEDILIGLLDKSAIELDESGAVKGGLAEQIEALRASKAFLFRESPQPIASGRNTHDHHQ